MKKPKKKPDQPETKEQRQQRERRERQRELSFDDDEEISADADDEEVPLATSCGIPGLSQSLPGMPAVLSMDRGRLLRRGMIRK